MVISFECFRESSDRCGNRRFGKSSEESRERGPKVSEFLFVLLLKWHVRIFNNRVLTSSVVLLFKLLISQSSTR